MLLLLSVSLAKAELQQQLTINGQTVESIVTRITFEGDNVVLHFKGGDSQTADMDAVVLGFVYSPTTSISVLRGTDDNYLDLAGLDEGTVVSIYDPQGKLITTTTAREAKTLLASSSLKNGVYVLKAGPKTVKVMKRLLSSEVPVAASFATRAVSRFLSADRNTTVSQVLLTLTNGDQRYYDTQSLQAIDIDNETGRVTLTDTDQQQEVFNATITTIAFAKGQGSSEGLVITEAKGWQESAYVKFEKMAGAKTYNVYVKGGQYAEYTKIDHELVREYPDYGRADIVGLMAGTYAVKVAPVDAEGNELGDKAGEATGLEVRNYDRAGYAHFNYSGVGAYNDDGTLKQGAKVFYITKTTAKTVSTSVAGANQNPCVGIQAIIAGYEKGQDTTPITFRFIGLVEKDDLDAIGSSEEGIQVKGKKADSKLNMTFEGIGDDATMRGFGFLVRNAKSVEFRNFGIMRCMDDGISLDTDNSNIWVHNIDFFYGKHGSGDHDKGDGACDAKSDTKYSTFSYCRYWDTGKTNMFGMKSESGPNYLSYHHNWFDHSDSRHPRVRTMSVHVWNNYFDNVAKYGVGATSGSSVFVENNYFLKTKKPILSSLQGTDGLGSGTFSGENGGMIKAYGNYFDR